MKNYKLDTKKIISTLVAAGVLASGTAVFAEYYPEKNRRFRKKIERIVKKFANRQNAHFV